MRPPQSECETGLSDDPVHLAHLDVELAVGIDQSHSGVRAVRFADDGLVVAIDGKGKGDRPRTWKFRRVLGSCFRIEIKPSPLGVWVGSATTRNFVFRVRIRVIRDVHVIPPKKALPAWPA